MRSITLSAVHKAVLVSLVIFQCVAFNTLRISAEDATSRLPKQQLADQASWAWDDGEASLIHSLRAYHQGRYSWSITSYPNDITSLDLQVFQDGQLRYQQRVHWQTVLRIEGDSLYLVRYSEVSPGGQAVCVNLGDGKTLWSCEIGQVVPWKSHFHSAYFSSRILHLYDGHVWVWGKESRGCFLNVLDAKSGTLVAARLYDPKEVQTNQDKRR